MGSITRASTFLIAVILIFLSRAYVTSANCLRELRAAKLMHKPLIVVYEPEEGHGGGTPSELLHLCPTALRAYLEEQSFIRWSLKPDQQLIALTLVCAPTQPAPRRAPRAISHAHLPCMQSPRISHACNLRPVAPARAIPYA